MVEDARLDVRRYASEATARLVATIGEGPDDWRDVIDRGLAAAQAQRDTDGLMRMVQLVTHLLESEGRFEDVLGELDYAIACCCGSADASILLHGIKASALMALQRETEAEATLAAGRTLLGAASSAFRLRFQVFELAVRFQRLVPINHGDVTRLMQACSEAGLDRDRLFLLTWYVPFLAVAGDRHRAHPFIREIRLSALASESRWRLSDAAAFELWDDFVGEPEMRRGRGQLERANAASVWRGEAVRLRESVLRRDAGAIEACLHTLRAARRTLATASVGLFEQFAAAANLSQRYTEQIEAGDPPASVNLNSLGALLAQAESVAVGGSQHSAARWRSSLEALLPPGVESSLEWPTSVRRVIGMLALRAGETRSARRWLEEAVDWSETVSFGTESALSRLQLGELCAHADLRVPERVWKTFRAEGAQDFARRGFDPVPQAYVVAHSLTLSTRNRLGEKLTRREVQVLALLAQGSSYERAGRELSISRATVQTFAHRAYEKLGVHGKVAAVAEAKRLGVL